MLYKIIVDKQSRTNPTSDKKEYSINIEELRYLGNVHDSLYIEKDETYVMRRLNLSDLHVLTILDEPVKEPLQDLNIELFEGDNYIYLLDMVGNKFYAEYLVKNEFTDLYVTTNEMNSAINQTAQSIELNVNQKLTDYSTTQEMNSAINVKANEITSTVINTANENTDTKLTEYPKTTTIGTLITQNTEAVKLAWNQISEFIQLMIVNNNASFAILDNSGNKLMTLDKKGQHFYETDGNTILGDIGVSVDTNDNNKQYLSFATTMDYDEFLDTGMAWGIKTKIDNKFHPIMYLKNYDMPQNGEPYGQLVFSGCDIVLEGINTGIRTGNVVIAGSPFGQLIFGNAINGTSLLSISSGGTAEIPYAEIKFLDNIKFFKNQAGSNSFMIGNTDTNYCLLTDNGSIHGNSIGSVNGIIYGKTFECYGHIYCNNGVEPFSLVEKKNNIKKYEHSALKEILKTDIYNYNYKDDPKGTKLRVGAIIGKDYNISKEIIGTEGKGIDTYSMMSVAYKAIQEQQEQIEELKKKIEELKKKIERLEVANEKD